MSIRCRRRRLVLPSQRPPGMHTRGMLGALVEKSCAVTNPVCVVVAELSLQHVRGHWTNRWTAAGPPAGLAATANGCGRIRSTTGGRTAAPTHLPPTLRVVVDRPQSVSALIARMDALLEPLETTGDQRRHFLATYRRTTVAVDEEIRRGGFLDGPWVERWDIDFASLYLDALDQWNAGRTASEPWAVAFKAAEAEDLPPLRHVLLGMNAHVNYDLPQALLATITDDEFDDVDLVARRGSDHEHIDGILASRVAAEDLELQAVERPGDRTVLDKLLTPFNQAGTKRFLREARGKVWRNAQILASARRQGEDQLAVRLRDLEALSAQKVADLRRPGQVILRLALRGFGVELGPSGGPRSWP